MGRVSKRVCRFCHDQADAEPAATRAAALGALPLYTERQLAEHLATGCMARMAADLAAGRLRRG